MKHKRILAMILAVASCLSLAVSASAANTVARKATDFRDFDMTMRKAGAWRCWHIRMTLPKPCRSHRNIFTGTRHFTTKASIRIST